MAISLVGNRRQKMGRWKRLNVYLFVLALVATACTSSDSEGSTTTTTTGAVDTTAAPGPTTATTATTATTEAPSGPSGSVRFLIAENFWADWDPYQHTAQSQRRIEAQIFDFLVDFPDTSAPAVPMLATEWTQIDDRTWEFKLRDDVTFHDGSAFDAADVKASIEMVSGATDVVTLETGNWTTTTVEVIDDFTVRLISEEPFAPLFSQLASTIIVSADDLANNAEAIKSQPNGTGPFRLVGNDPTRKVMEANTDYWQGSPQIQTLIWEFIQDADTRLSALLAGQADAIDRVPPQHLQIIDGSGNLVLTSVTGIESVNLWVAPGRLPIWDESVAFREAVMRSIDRDSLVAGLVQGASAVATSFLPSNTLYHQAGDPVYSRDVDVAKALLSEAGVPDGGPEFELWVAEGFQPRAVEVGSAIVANMEEVGLKPKLVVTDVSALIDDIFSDDGTGAVYHLSWSSNGDPFNHAFVYSDNFAWYFGDERLQELIDLSASTTDLAAREDVVHELQAYMWEQLWHVPLYNSDFTIANNTRLVGLDVRPNFQTRFYPAGISE
jgi:peptide/nickel transport system substrate-binding protein